VSVPGWSGAGYIILDPETGSGAFKIGGGQNGGLLFIVGALMFFLGMFLVSSGFGAIAGAALIYYGTKLIGLGFALLMSDPDVPFDTNTFLTIFSVLYVLGVS
jgi:hypothetical protein